MNPIRWQKPKWLPTFLSMPVPEPAQQASRILSIQRNIILPARVMVAVAVFYFLFYQQAQLVETPSWSIVRETLQNYYFFYVIFNFVAAMLLILRRFPPRLVQWVVFSVGLVDGVLLAGLTLETSGFGSTLYWVFPGLIIVNAVSIPLATPQIVLNLALSAFYLGAGWLYITVSESGSTLYPTSALHHHISTSKFLSSDISDLDSLAAKLKQPAAQDGLMVYLNSQLAARTRELLSQYTGGSNAILQHALVDDLNRIALERTLYNSNRFARVQLSKESKKLLSETAGDTEPLRLNRRLLQDAFPREILRRRALTPYEELNAVHESSEFNVPAESGTEPWVLRLIILWLITASCYGLQLLVFREQVSFEEERKSSARNDELKAAGRLAAEIAHQLKNPLGIINNAIFSLQRGLKEGKKTIACNSRSSGRRLSGPTAS